MGVKPMHNAGNWMLEANRFWFYSLLFSIAGLCLQLFRDGRKPEITVGKELKAGETEARAAALKASAVNIQRTRVQLIADCVDLLVPGHVTGWIPTSTLISGIASVVSTSISLNQIWAKI